LNREDYSVQNQVKPQTFNIEPQRTDLRNAFTTTQSLAKNGSAGNAGAYLSTMGNTFGKYNSANAGLLGQKENMENQSIMQSQMAGNRVNQFNSQMGFQIDNWNQKSKDATQNHLGAATTQLGQIGARENYYDFMTGLYKSQPNVTEDVGQRKNQRKEEKTKKAFGGYFYKPKKK
jgi:hypothetical protein